MNIIQGDCIEAMRAMASDSCDSLVTDPPAGIAFMGKEWDGDKGGRKAWVKWMAEVMGEALRVLKPGAHGLVWALPRTSHWTATALEEAGFEVRDVITHLFGTGFPKSLDISKAIDRAAGAEREVIGTNEDFLRRNPGNKVDGIDRLKEYGGGPFGEGQAAAAITAPSTDGARQWSGWGTALKPASEHWILVRKPLGEKTVAANVLEHGTGAINVGACRVGTEIVKSEQRDTAAWSGNNWSGKPQKSNGIVTESIGRWPANVVLSHSPDCVQSGTRTVGSGEFKTARESRSEMAQESWAIVSKGGGVAPDNYGVETVEAWDCVADCAVKALDGNSRFFYTAKASRTDRGADNKHPTVKSTKLMQYLVRLVTPPGGIVLDPFAGSGSTGVAAKREGFDFVGIERESEYVETARKRLES